MSPLPLPCYIIFATHHINAIVPFNGMVNDIRHRSPSATVPNCNSLFESPMIGTPVNTTTLIIILKKISMFYPMMMMTMVMMLVVSSDKTSSRCYHRKKSHPIHPLPLIPWATIAFVMIMVNNRYICTQLVLHRVITMMD